MKERKDILAVILEYEMLKFYFILQIQTELVCTCPNLDTHSLFLSILSLGHLSQFVLKLG